MNKECTNPGKASWKITRIYIVIGCLWILLSDKVVELVVTDTTAFRIISNAKGWFYVWVTAALLYRLIKAPLQKTVEAQDEVVRSYEELAIAHSHLRSHQEQLQFLASHDDLTGLPNRMALFQELKTILANPESKGALLFIDVDNFKYINDSMGHAVGDELLASFSERLKNIIAKDWELFRLGGDEYVLLARDSSESEVMEFTHSLHIITAETFELTTTSVRISISTGITFYPEHGFDPELLLKNADIAMYHAKGPNSNSFEVFDESMNLAISERLILDQALRGALKNNEFGIVYQPQYEFETDHICGFEALLRWNNPQLGTIPPDRFIPIAEQSGLIIPIGKWVLENAGRYIKSVHQAGLGKLTLSVNVSVVQLRQPDYTKHVLEVLEENELEPKCLELEITESVLMESSDEIEGKLILLQEQGIGISLDDFGTGYSSLDYLRKLPITTLKIDKSFVHDLRHGYTGMLVQGIIDIGKAAGILTLAEGVETREQFEFLATAGCDKFQGYLYSKPISGDEAIALLRETKKVASSLI